MNGSFLRRFAPLLILCLLCAHPLFAEGGPGYVFDLSDRESTRVSSGTGGNEPACEPFDGGTTMDYFIYRDDPAKPGDVWADTLYDHLRIDPDDTALWNLLNDWRLQACDVLLPTAKDGVLTVVTQRQGDLISMEVRSDRYVRTAVFDRSTYRRLALSDLFYDGFNYIEHINRWLAAAVLSSHPDVMNGWEGEPALALEDALIGPFSGFPADYPFFYANRYGLVLLVDADNPFFYTAEWGNKANLLVPLSHAISPWFDCDVDYELMNVPFGKEQIPFPKFLLDNGANPEAEQRIEQDLLRSLGAKRSAAAVLQSCDKWWALQPHIVQFGQCVSIRYTFDDNEVSQALLLGWIYDMHTGEPLPLHDLLLAWQDDPAVAWLLLEDDWHYAPKGTQVTRPDGLEQAEVLAGYLHWGDLMLRLRIPSGEMLHVTLPDEALLR